MGDNSTIEWTDATWNPVTGCSHVSHGCDHCYAEALSLRYRWSTAPWTPENAEQNVILHPKRLEKPLTWRKPRMVFVNSMSDLFHPRVPTEYIQAVFGIMKVAKQHTFQVLTKRPKRMRDWCKAYQLDPLPNVWLGTSIESREYVGRADLVRETPAAVRFISAEPLLGPLLPDADHMVDQEHVTYPLGDAPVYAWREWADGHDGPGLNLEEIDWLIVGGESGPGHRPIRPEWVRDLKDYCQDDCWQGEREGHAAFFFKQWGGAYPKANGRELDGRTYDEMPEVANVVA